MSDRAMITGGAPARPTADVARQMKQVRFNPIRHATPASLARDLDMFDGGYLRAASLLWEKIEERDDMVRPTSLERKSTVSARKFEVVTPVPGEEAEAHKAALEYFFNHLTVTDALDLNVKGTFSLLVEQMMSAMLNRYAVHEVIWQPGRRDAKGRPALTAELKFCPLYLFENTSGRLAYTGPLASTAGVPLDQDGWMITTGDGIMTAVSVAWMFKRLSLTDWLNFSEKFGIPGVHGTTNAPKGTPEWNEFVNALERFANDWIMASATGSEVKLIEVGKSGDAPFSPMVERMDRSITILMLGSDLATLSRENGTGASLQGASTERRLARDCERVSSTLQVELSRKVIAMLFGEGVEPLAYVQIPPPKSQDVKQDIAVDEHLAKHRVPQSVEDMAERYGRTLPDADERLIGADAPDFTALQNASESLDARELFADALRADLQPVRRAIATVLQARDDGEARDALAQLHSRWPNILAAVMAGDSVGTAMDRILGASFVEGLDLASVAAQALEEARPTRAPRA